MEEKIYTKTTITIPRKLRDEFKEFCDSNGITFSGRVAILIQEDLKNKSLRSKG